MSHHEHDHGHSHHGHAHEHHDHHGGRRRGIHRDWRAWLVVGLMLAAMAMYLASMDESIRPGGATGQPMPAAEAPPAGVAP
jgi:hypothetical protein